MICLNCKKQIADDSNRCPFCGYEVIHQEQVKKEIGFRRYQRWFFYGVISIIFIGMVYAIVIVYNKNSDLVQNVNSFQVNLDARQKELESTKLTLEEKIKLLENLEKTLTEKETEISTKTTEFKKVVDEKVQIEDQYKDCQVDLTSADSNIYSLIINLGTGISNDSLKKIPLADANLEGDDADQDGLSDLVEASLGTDKDKKDTDGDSFEDKAEIIGGYNPNGEGEVGIDTDYALMQKGKILLQTENKGEAWYIGQNGRRYFLGTPADAFRIMRNLEYWTKDYKKAQ